MFPKTDEDSEIHQRKSKPFIGLGFMRKILPASNKKYSNNYVFDAVPAVPREGGGLGLSVKDKSTKDVGISHNNSSNDSNASFNGLGNSQINEEEIKDDKIFDEDAQDKSNKKERKDKTNENDKSSNKKSNIPHDENNTDTNVQNNIMNQTNVTIYDGTNIHFGNVYKTVNNNTMVYNTNNIKLGQNYNDQHSTKMKMSQPIKTLMKCKNQIGNGHLQFLSQHFGSEWKEIGKHLNLTKEEISNKQFRKKEPQERSYQMMLLWAKKPENRNATLGILCKILWDSQKKAAQEAIKQLAANLNDFD